MALERDELGGWLRLSTTPGVGNATARRLLSAFGLPAQIFSQSVSVLASCVSAKQAASLAMAPEGLEALLDETWQWLLADPRSRRVLTLGDPHFPSALLEMEDPPLVLYALGPEWVWQRNMLLEAQACLAVVGSRNPTAQGAANAKQFSQALAQAGLTIVSGMALGVDGAAHEGALSGAGPEQVGTVAIVGTGLDRIYPKQHRDLAHRIARNGLILSEYHIGTPPLAPNFPKRNRLIAGLCRGTLVVEAALKSGSLITARLAVEQGKDVFAIPGSIHSTQARGCHALIKQGAKLVECAQDILEEMQHFSAHDAPADTAGTNDDADEQPEQDPLFLALGFDPVSFDGLVIRTGMATAQLQVSLMELELDGLVARLPGGLFQRVGGK